MGHTTNIWSHPSIQSQDPTGQTNNIQEQDRLKSALVFTTSDVSNIKDEPGTQS